MNQEYIDTVVDVIAEDLRRGAELVVDAFSEEEHPRDEKEPIITLDDRVQFVISMVGRSYTEVEAALRVAGYNTANQSVKFLDEHNTANRLIEVLDEYKYSSTQINIPEPLRSSILSFPIDGERETDPHITVKYGLHDGVSASDVAAICQGFGAIRVVLGTIDVFESDPPNNFVSLKVVPRGTWATRALGYIRGLIVPRTLAGDSDVVKINITSPNLHRLNQLISNLPHTDTHLDYQPHITLAYVPAGQGVYYKGISTFVGEEFTVDSLVFCDTDGDETTIPLTPHALEFDESKHPRNEHGQWAGDSYDHATEAVNDPEIARDVSVVPGDTSKKPWELSQQEYEALPLVHRGGSIKAEHVFVTNNKSLAKIHGTARSYRLAPGTKIYADPEEIGMAATDRLTGFDSLNEGSAVIRSDALWPSEYHHWRHARAVDDEPRDKDGQWTAGGTSSSRAERALATYKPSTRAKQLKAAASEKTIAATLGGQDLPDNEPMDVIVKIGSKTHGVEVKTLIDNSNNKITCHPESRIRKEQWCRKNKAAGHTVVVDKRGSTPVYYHRSGFGAFRLAGMDRVSLKDLKKRITS